MKKLINLEFKNNRLLYFSILGVFVFSVIIITIFKFLYGNYKMDTDNYLWVVVLGILIVLPLTLFQTFNNEKYDIYLILTENRLKQFLVKLILPFISISIYYNILNSLIGLSEQLIFRVLSVEVVSIFLFNNFIIFPSLIFLIVIVFLKYCKKGVSKIYKGVFSIIIINYIFFYIQLESVLIDSTSIYLHLMTYLLFDSLLLAVTYLFYSKIEV